MENATKALLIAAAILIAIVLVALGVSLLSNVGETSKQAGNVGMAIGDETENAADQIVGSLDKVMLIDEIKRFLAADSWQWTTSNLNDLEDRYGDYRYRVYDNKNKETISSFSEQLWEKSKVMKKLPSGYVARLVKRDDSGKRMVIIITPKN